MFLHLSHTNMFFSSNPDLEELNFYFINSSLTYSIIPDIVDLNKWNKEKFASIKKLILIEEHLEQQRPSKAIIDGVYI